MRGGVRGVDGYTSAPPQTRFFPMTGPTFQQLIQTLNAYWAKQGCVLIQPLDLEVGAGTFHPATFLRALGPEPWNAAYVQPCRRPTDGRYGDNPNRLQRYYQYQVAMKPNPDNIVELYFDSLKELGIDPEVHDLRLVEDNLRRALQDDEVDAHRLSQIIRRTVGKWVSDTHRRRPMIIPVVLEA